MSQKAVTSQTTVTPQKAVPRTNNQQEQRDETKYEEKKMYSGVMPACTLA